jgi:lipopolysaccharide transport system ATP-binding protein
MIVRLGFAVAAFLEPDILVVDEVLAVGDAEFQKKAIGKMQNVSTNDGRTVLFVSHNMGSISRLCKTGLLLKNGQINESGEIKTVIEAYLKEDSINPGYFEASLDSLKPTQILSVKVLNKKSSITDKFSFEDEIYIDLEIKNRSLEKGIRCNIGVWDKYDSLIMLDRIKLGRSDDYIKYRGLLKGKILLPNRYKITVSIDIPNIKVIELLSQTVYFDIVDNTGLEIAQRGDLENGLIKSFFEWSVQ